mmetsp:Transcript_1202/g.2492  ORF Transcript_1202/g.2492 Transcript_1202/m.2492 type:complete len:250 (-) Transcript_1202:1010-1759(-)
MLDNYYMQLREQLYSASLCMMRELGSHFRPNRRRVPSSDADATTSSSLLTATSCMPAPCPPSVRTQSPVRASQTRTFASRHPVTTTGLFGSHFKLTTPSWFPCISVALMASVCKSQIMTVPSILPEATMFIQGQNATLSTLSVCPSKLPFTLPLARATRRADLSSDPDTIKPPSASQSKDVSPLSWYGWPWTVRVQAPLRGSQARSVPSSDPVTTVLPSGVKVPQFTEPPCPVNTCMHAPVEAFHIHAE